MLIAFSKHLTRPLHRDVKVQRRFAASPQGLKVKKQPSLITNIKAARFIVPMTSSNIARITVIPSTRGSCLSSTA